MSGADKFMAAMTRVHRLALEHGLPDDLRAAIVDLGYTGEELIKALDRNAKVAEDRADLLQASLCLLEEARNDLISGIEHSPASKLCISIRKLVTDIAQKGARNAD